MISRRCAYRGISWVLPLLILLAACAGPKAVPIQLPSNLPLTTDDEEFEVRWALQETPGLVQAVGTVSGVADAALAANVTLTLFGLGRDGKIVSRGVAFVAGPFDRGQTFAIKVKPKGREAKWEIRVSGVIDSADRMRW